ncbi:unnamed protein product [Sphagnum balticum]|jgi:hypothetical protein
MELKIAPQLKDFKVLDRWTIEGNLKCIVFGDLTTPEGPVGYQWIMVFIEEQPDGSFDEKLFVAAEYHVEDEERPRRLALGLFTKLGHEFREMDKQLYDYEYFCRRAMEVGRPLI